MRELNTTEITEVAGGLGSACDWIEDRARDAGRAVGRVAREIVDALRC